MTSTGIVLNVFERQQSFSLFYFDAYCRNTYFCSADKRFASDVLDEQVDGVGERYSTALADCENKAGV